MGHNTLSETGRKWMKLEVEKFRFWAWILWLRENKGRNIDDFILHRIALLSQSRILSVVFPSWYSLSPLFLWDMHEADPLNMWPQNLWFVPVSGLLPFIFYFIPHHLTDFMLHCWLSGVCFFGERVFWFCFLTCKLWEPPFSNWGVGDSSPWAFSRKAFASFDHSGYPFSAKLSLKNEMFRERLITCIHSIECFLQQGKMLKI